MKTDLTTRTAGLAVERRPDQPLIDNLDENNVLSTRSAQTANWAVRVAVIACLMPRN